MAELPELRISTDKVCFIVVKSRQFQVKDVVTEPDPASNPADDSMREVLESHPDDPVAPELLGAFRDLNEDEKIDLVSLMRLGRGDVDVAEWADLQTEVADDLGSSGTPTIILRTPLLADYLEEGLAVFGQSCAAEEADHLST